MLLWTLRAFNQSLRTNLTFMDLPRPRNSNNYLEPLQSPMLIHQVIPWVRQVKWENKVMWYDTQWNPQNLRVSSSLGILGLPQAPVKYLSVPHYELSVSLSTPSSGTSPLHWVPLGCICTSLIPTRLRSSIAHHVFILRSQERKSSVFQMSIPCSS